MAETTRTVIDEAMARDLLPVREAGTHKWDVGGVIVVAGPEAWRGGQHGLVLQRVKDDQDVEHVAGDYFRRMGDYLT